MQRCISNNGVPRRLRCDQAQTFSAKKFQLFCKSNHVKLLFSPVDDHSVVKRLIKTLKRRLGVMKIDSKNTPFRLASDVAEIIKTLRITPHGVTKITPFEAHTGRKANTPLSNIATKNSPNNLNWENTKHACLDRKSLLHHSIPSEIRHELQKWSEDEITFKHGILEPTFVKQFSTLDDPQRSSAAVKTRRALALEKEKLNLRSKGIQQQINPCKRKKFEKIARKTVRLATKVKEPSTFETKTQNDWRENTNMHATYSVGTNDGETTEIVVNRVKKKWFYICT